MLLDPSAFGAGIGLTALGCLCLCWFLWLVSHVTGHSLRAERPALSAALVAAASAVLLVEPGRSAAAGASVTLFMAAALARAFDRP